MFHFVTFLTSLLYSITVSARRRCHRRYSFGYIYIQLPQPTCTFRFLFCTSRSLPLTIFASRSTLTLFSTCFIQLSPFLFLSGSFLRVDLVNLDHLSCFSRSFSQGFSRVLVDSESSLTLAPSANSLVSPSRSTKSEGEGKTDTRSIRCTTGKLSMTNKCLPSHVQCSVGPVGARDRTPVCSQSAVSLPRNSFWLFLLL